MNWSPEEKIGEVLKSSLTNLTVEDFTSLMEKHMIDLQLLKKPNEWSHPQFEAKLNHIYQSDNHTLQYMDIFVDRIAQNAAKNNYLHTFLSQVNESEIKNLQEIVKLEGSTVLPDVLAYAVVLETLNSEMVGDHNFAQVCFDIWSKYDPIQNVTGFGNIKVKSIGIAMNQFLGFIKEKKIDPSYGKIVSFNIFQAMAEDFKLKRLDNVLAGKTLAVNKPGVDEKQKLAGPTTISENGQTVEFRPPLPNLWADLYETWNMAFVTKYPDWPYFLVKLIIPSVSDYHEHPEGYLYSRVTALYAQGVMTLSLRAKGQWGRKMNWKSEEFSQAWGRFNRASARDYEKQLKKAHNES